MGGCGRPMGVAVGRVFGACGYRCCQGQVAVGHAAGIVSTCEAAGETKGVY